MLKKTIIAAVATCGVAVALAVPAGAQPDRPSCGLALSFVCAMVPEGVDPGYDVDLSKQIPADPNAPNPEMLPPLDP